MYEDQNQEIEKAVVGVGEYKLSSPYLLYGVQTKDWFKKSQKQRERILYRFGKAKLSPVKHGFSVCAPGTDEREQLADDIAGPSTSNPLQHTKLPASI